MRTLILLRHAKAVPEDPGGDHARALAPRGREEAVAAGRALGVHGNPDFALVSDARRTRETLAGVEAALDRPLPHRVDPRLYGASPDAILARVATVPAEVATLLVIGHNPGLGDLARRLASRGDARAREPLAARFPTSAFAVLRFEDAEGWSDLESGRLMAFVPDR